MKYPTFVKNATLIQKNLEQLFANIEASVGAETRSRFEIGQIKFTYITAQADYEQFTGTFNKVLAYDLSDEELSVVHEFHTGIRTSYIKIAALYDESQTTAENAEKRQVHSTNTNTKLPKLNLRHFSGQLSEWIGFINLYNSAIHQNEKLTKVEKFTYLVSILHEEPLNLIKGLSLSDENYAIAYDILVKRYQNNRNLICLHLNNILELPTLHSYSAKDLRHFLNIFMENTQALNSLNCNITENNPLLALMILKRLDKSTRNRFESNREESADLPSVKELVNFINSYLSHAEAASLNFDELKLNSAKQEKSRNQTRFDQRKQTFISKNVAKKPNKLKCFYCNDSTHAMYHCNKFKLLNAQDRFKFVKTKNLCVNCFSNIHTVKDCNSKHFCFTCNKKHHTLIHLNVFPDKSEIRQVDGQTTSKTSPPEANEIFAGHARHISANKSVLLATALVKIVNPKTKQYQILRGILDCASHSSFITEKAAHLLNVKRYPSEYMVGGIAEITTNCNDLTYLNVQTVSGENIQIEHQFLILNEISGNLPYCDVPEHVTRKINNSNILLADPTYNKASPVDLLMGAELFTQLFWGNSIAFGKLCPIAYKTKLGYVLMGPYYHNKIPAHADAKSFLTITNNDLDRTITRFWNLEQIPNATKVNKDDEFCENHFVQTHDRDPNGRYIVRLPFNPKFSQEELGESFIHARNRFASLERKFELDTEFSRLYCEFMHNYLQAGYMKICEPHELKNIKYFLPHHGVLKMNSTSTRLRVVFDASAVTTSGKSLNDLLLPGPKLHNEISDIICTFRLHNFVFFCDIKQMFLQIKLHPEDQNFQAILWRPNSSEEIKVYKLSTVAFGMTSSPFLAIRTLQQLASEEGERFQRAAKILREFCFVDNLFSGASTEQEAIELQEELIQLLRTAGFELRKFGSNSAKLLTTLPGDYYETPLKFTELQDPQFSVLGMLWSPTVDSFSYQVNNISHSEKFTKRQVLSIIAQIYDPCGFLSPITFAAKCFMQSLWTKALGWDDPLPDDLLGTWNAFIQEWHIISKFSIPRSLSLTASSYIQLHGFGDASELGYGAVVYLRNELTPDTVVINQIIAKTRVAPLRKISLPRLELNAAHLLARLLKYATNIISPHYKIQDIFAWSDSTVVLSWIQTESYKLTTYVANRVSEIQDLTTPSMWRHVKGSENPADCCSRGLTPTQLSNHTLWWGGPNFLKLPQKQWPENKILPLKSQSLPEIKITPQTCLTATTPNKETLFERFSSWMKLLRTYAYVLRFVNNTRKGQKTYGHISTEEINRATLIICKIVQRDSFKEDIAKLKNQLPTRWKQLSPFIDDDGLVRVGGRLIYAAISTDTKFPIILPKTHIVTNLIIDYYHVVSLHAGPQLLQSTIAQKFWILSARSAIRAKIRKCNRCFRCKPYNQTPLMGQLPAARVTPSRPFAKCGTDLGGPFQIKSHTALRNARITKAYICVFVCFATKAVHIEVLTDLTAAAFIAALKRFVSRRGYCQEIYCDHGTNFVGANNELRRITNQLFKNQQTQQALNYFATPRGIKFNFIPPASPHMGGLWESAIKSIKHHLKRVMGETILSLEEFMTLTAQIESILNSRPLIPLSQDSEDLHVLTPAHFLIGGSMFQIPEEEVSHINLNRLKRWQLVQAFVQRIWKRWSKEYLNTLHQRLKWQKQHENLKKGDLVLIRQEDTAPLTWPIGRITEVIKGKDETVRSAKIKTAAGEIHRPAVKLFTLPTQ